MALLDYIVAGYKCIESVDIGILYEKCPSNPHGLFIIFNKKYITVHVSLHYDEPKNYVQYSRVKGLEAPRERVLAFATNSKNIYIYIRHVFLLIYSALIM